jgi:hypothetical protein
VRRRRIASHLSQTRFMYATTTSAVTIVGAAAPRGDWCPQAPHADA